MSFHPLSADHPLLFAVTSVLEDAPTGLTLNELQALCGARTTAVSRALATLEAGGRARLSGRRWRAPARPVSSLAGVSWPAPHRSGRV